MPQLGEDAGGDGLVEGWYGDEQRAESEERQEHFGRKGVRAEVKLRADAAQKSEREIGHEEQADQGEGETQAHGEDRCAEVKYDFGEGAI